MPSEVKYHSRAPESSQKKTKNLRRAPTVDVRPKVNLADVVVAQHSGVSCVGGVVSSTVVDGAAGGESQACLQPVFFDEPPGAVLQPLTAGSRKQQRDYCQGRQCVRESCSYVCVSVETTSCSQMRQYAGARLTRCRSWSSPV